MSFPKPSWWHRDQIWNTQAISCSSTSSSSTTYFINLPASVKSVWLDSVSCHPPVRWTNLDLWKKIVLLKLIETVLGIFISRKPFLCSFTCSVHPQKHTPKRAWRFFLGPWRYKYWTRYQSSFNRFRTQSYRRLRPLRRSALKVVKHWSDQWEQQGVHDVSLSLEGERMGWTPSNQQQVCHWK